MVGDIIVVAAIILIIGGALTYIIKAKKSGKKCIGCPDSDFCGMNNNSAACGGNCNSCSGCNKNK